MHAYRLGADDQAAKEKPAHGRTAKVKGPAGVFKWGSKIIRYGTKAMVVAFSGGTAGKLYDAALDAISQSVKQLSVDEQRAWFNDSPNENVWIWAVAWSRKGAAQAYADQSKRGQQTQQILRALRIVPADFDTRAGATRGVLKTMLWLAKLNLGPLAPGMVDHVLQATLLLEYGPLGETWLIVKRQLKRKPSGDFAKVLPKWVDETLALLDQYRARRSKATP